MGTDKRFDNYRIRVLDRTFDLLDALAASEHPISTADLCRRSRLSKSTAHRLLTVLETRRVVERQSGTHLYRLGSKLDELASGSRPNQKADCAQEALDRLAFRTGGMARLGVLRMSEQISLVFTSRASQAPGAARSDVKMPIHCTALGKAIVAFEPLLLGELLPYYRFVPYTSRTITAPGKFRAELRKVQSCGFAYDNEEYKPGFRCIAAPLRDSQGRVIAAVSVSETTSEINLRSQGEIIRALQRAAQELSASAESLFSPAH